MLLLLLKLRIAPAIKRTNFNHGIKKKNSTTKLSKIVISAKLHPFVGANLIAGVHSEFYYISLLELNHKPTQSLFYLKVYYTPHNVCT